MWLNISAFLINGFWVCVQKGLIYSEILKKNPMFTYFYLYKYNLKIIFFN